MVEKTISFRYIPNSVCVAVLSVGFEMICLYDSTPWKKNARPFICKTVAGKKSKDIYVDGAVPANPRELYNFLYNHFDNTEFEFEGE